VKRRQFITLLGGATVAWPLAARGQQPDRVRRIGVLLALAKSDPEGQARMVSFRQELRKLGWTEGRNIRIDDRWPAADIGQIERAAAELVALSPDVIFVNSQPGFDIMRQATRTIPVVFVQVTDPVGAGFVASLARPSGNLTGLSNYDLGGKLLELLKEISPDVTRAAVIYNSENASNIAHLHSIDAAKASFGVDLTAAAVRDADDIKRQIDEFARRSGGLIVLASPTTNLHRNAIIALAARHRLPAVYPYRYFVVSGGLASYGVDNIELYRRAAGYVDRILRGEKPGDLPIQQPTKLELALNLKTARMLGLTVPPMLLARADEVIE
jgi:putative ABC transport system substrate-binding protein